MIRPAIFGLAAAIAGAVIYYTVTKLTGWEHGLVAILTGYMFGYTLRACSGRIAGRRFQILAAVLTDISVGLAYLALSFPGLVSMERAAALSIPSLIVYTLVVPISTVVASFPSGVLSACIIGFGMYQAWQMTAALG